MLLHLPNVYLHNILIPTSKTVEYLGLNLDKRFTWNSRIHFKKLALNTRLRRLRTLLINNKYFGLKVKVLMYKALLKPLWTYGLQLWGIAKVSNTNKIQQFQNIALRKITSAHPLFLITLCIKIYQLKLWQKKLHASTKTFTPISKPTKIHSLKTYPPKPYLTTPDIV